MRKSKTMAVLDNQPLPSTVGQLADAGLATHFPPGRCDRDTVTGLFNHYRLQEELVRAVSAGERLGQRVALLVFSLDRMAGEGELPGHGSDDMLSRRMAAVVSGQIRRNEVFAHLEGDEFAILAPEAEDLDVRGLAERVVRTVSGLSQMNGQGQPTSLGCSVGLALFPDHARSVDDLLGCAAVALQRAREAGRNHWCLWQEEQVQPTREESTFYDWEVRIDAALDHDRMRLHYQGTYDCAGGALAHLDAMVRLQDGSDPKHLILPGIFLPVAERNGRIRDIDHWVVRHGIRTLRDNPGLSGLVVKLSLRSQLGADSADYIIDMLEREGVNPARLIVEVTENAVNLDIYRAQRFVGDLQRAGCRVCLTRFGSGFASLDSLRHVDVDQVKIDVGFTRDLANDPHNQAIVKAMVNLVHALGRRITAGGVEDEASLAVLRDLGVDYVQGYFFEQPGSAHPALAAATRH